MRCLPADLHNPLRPNWKSLCQPAVLPLTTDYWRAQAELRLNYSEYNHTLVLVQNQNDYNNGQTGGRECCKNGSRAGGRRIKE